MTNPQPIRPDRIRTIEKPFAWIPFRILKDGFFADLSDQAKLLYIFLCLAADRKGTSFYGDNRIQTYFQLDTEKINNARKELINKDLIAYDGRLYQVLSLPSQRQSAAHEIEPTMEHRTGEPEPIAEILKRLASLSH